MTTTEKELELIKRLQDAVINYKVADAKKIAEEAVAACDLMLIAGSSLMVFPAASLPLRALERGVPLIVVNQTPTYIDERVDVVIHGDLADIIPRLALEVLRER